MHYPLYCITCDQLTGHIIHPLKSNCLKCGADRKTPIVKWILGILFFVGTSALLIWWIVSTILMWFGVAL